MILGSVLNHVLLHQTIVGLEAKKQLEMIDEKPNIIIGCLGGGNNFAGLCYPFIKDAQKDDIKIIAVEPTVCPSSRKECIDIITEIPLLTPLQFSATYVTFYVAENVITDARRPHPSGVKPARALGTIEAR